MLLRNLGVTDGFISLSKYHAVENNPETTTKSYQDC